MHELKEGTESLPVLWCLNVEVNTLETSIKWTLFHKWVVEHMRSLAIRKSYHIPVQVLNKETTVVSEEFNILCQIAFGYQAHVHLIVSGFGQGLHSQLRFFDVFEDSYSFFLFFLN